MADTCSTFYIRDSQPDKQIGLACMQADIVA